MEVVGRSGVVTGTVIGVAMLLFGVPRWLDPRVPVATDLPATTSTSVAAPPPLPAQYVAAMNDGRVVTVDAAGHVISATQVAGPGQRLLSVSVGIGALWYAERADANGCNREIVVDNGYAFPGGAPVASRLGLLLFFAKATQDPCVLDTLVLRYLERGTGADVAYGPYVRGRAVPFPGFDHDKSRLPPNLIDGAIDADWV
jgi:hypothetical protein